MHRLISKYSHEQGFLGLNVFSILFDVCKHTLESTPPHFLPRIEHWKGIVLVSLLSHKQLSLLWLVQAMKGIHFKREGSSYNH